MMYKINAKKIISIVGVMIFLSSSFSFACDTGDVFGCCIDSKSWSGESNITSYVNIDINNTCCYEA